MKFSQGPEAEINNQVMALVSAMPTFAKNDFSESDPALPRQLLFHPRKNVNMYTSWRIRHLRRRRKELLANVDKGVVESGGTSLSEAAGVVDGEQKSAGGPVVDRGGSSSEVVHDHNEQNTAGGQGVVDVPPPDSAGACGEAAVFRSGVSLPREDTDRQWNAVFRQSTFGAHDRTAEELVQIEAELESLGVDLDGERNWRYGRMGKYKPEITVDEYLEDR